jgi:hypothetical protein
VIQQRHLTLIGRAALAIVGAGTATMMAVAGPAAAGTATAPQSGPSLVSALKEEPSGTGSDSGTGCSTPTGGGSSTGNEASEGSNSGGGTGGSNCIDNGTAPGGPGYNGVDPRG